MVHLPLIIKLDSNILDVGGYCKEYTKGKRPVGVALDDTWLLRYVVSIYTVRIGPLAPSFRLELPSADPTSPTTAPSSKAKAASTAVPYLPTTKWEKRKKIGYTPNPSPRSGCSLTCQKALLSYGQRRNRPLRTGLKA